MATLATYNVTSGRNGRLEQALRAMKVANVDVGVLTEAKLTKDIYTRFSSGYHVMATEAPSAQQGGVALFWRDSPTHQVEGQRTWGPNVVSFELVTGGLRYYVVGAYCPPSDPEASTTEDISAAFGAAKPGRQRILIGDVNAVVAAPRYTRDEIVADCVAATFQEAVHFHPWTKDFAPGFTARITIQTGFDSSSSDSDYLFPHHY